MLFLFIIPLFDTRLISRCFMPSFKIIGLLVLEKQTKVFFLRFCYLLSWRPSWSYDLDNLYKLLFLLSKDASREVWL